MPFSTLLSLRRGRNSTSALQKREALWGYLFLLPAIVFLAVFVVYATLVGITRSFCDWNFMSLNEWKFIGLGNYVRLTDDPIFLLTLKNLLAILVGKLVIQVGGGLVIADILHHLKSLKRVLRTIYFMPAVVAPVAVGLLWSYIFEPDMGLVTKLFATLGMSKLAVPWLSDPVLSLVSIILVDSWQWLSFPMVLFIAGMQAIPEELYEAAQIDGANRYHLFRYITIPGLRTITSVVIILVTINGIKLFDLVRAMTRGGPYYHTETPSTLLFQVGVEKYQLGYACAMATVVVVLCLVLAIIELGVLEHDED